MLTASFWTRYSHRNFVPPPLTVLTVLLWYSFGRMSHRHCSIQIPMSSVQLVCFDLLLIIVATTFSKESAQTFPFDDATSCKLLPVFCLTSSTSGVDHVSQTSTDAPLKLVATPCPANQKYQSPL